MIGSSKYRTYPQREIVESGNQDEGSSFSGTIVNQNIAPTNNQTSFTLTSEPANSKVILFSINGVIVPTKYYTLSGTTLTYTNTDIIIEATDEIFIVYLT